jgi:hypothetical protein
MTFLELVHLQGETEASFLCFSAAHLASDGPTVVSVAVCTGMQTHFSIGARDVIRRFMELGERAG